MQNTETSKIKIPLSFVVYFLLKINILIWQCSLKVVLEDKLYYLKCADSETFIVLVCS